MRHVRRLVTYCGPVLLVLALAACSEDPARALERHVRAGDAFASQGKYPEATIEYRAALQVDPRLGNIRLKLADAYLQVNDPSNALREYVRAADLLPDSKEAQLKAGNILLFAGQFEDAKQRAENVLVKEPTDSDALIVLANSMAGLRDLPSALSTLEALAEQSPANSDVSMNLGIFQYMGGNPEQAEESFKNAIVGAPKSVTAHLALAHFYWSGKRLDEAATEFQKALSLEPDHVLANRSMALFYITTGQPALAERHLKAVTAALPHEVAPRILLADFYLVTDREDEARILLEAMKTEAAAFGIAQPRLAALVFARSSHLEGHRLIDEVLAKEPNNAAALLIKGRFLLADRRLDQALESVEAATKVDPGLASAFGTLGDVYVERKDWDNAAEAYGQVLKLAPKSAQAQRRLAEVHLQRGEGPLAISFAEQATRTEPNSAEGYLILAQALIAQGDLPRAEVTLNRISALKDTTAAVLVQVGRLRLAESSYAAAQRAFARALEIDTASVDAVDGLVSVALALKNPAEARRVAEAEVARRPKDAQLRVVAARAYDAVGDNAATENTLREAIQINPVQLDGYMQLAKLYARTHRLDEARIEFTKVLAQQPKSIPAGTMLGMVLQLQGKSEDASKQYEKTVQLDSRAAIAANNLAWLSAESGGNLDVALQLAQSAKAQLPDRHEITDTLGWVYYKKGFGSLAVSSLKQSVAAQPTNPTYLYHLGLAYALIGDQANARQCLERALKIAPNFDNADDARRFLRSMAG